MKRTTKPAAQRFRKLGGGSMRIGNRIIKKNEVFSANPEDIPVTMRDLVQPIGRSAKEVFTSGEKQAAPARVEEKEYNIVQKSRGWYDLLADGKKINESAMRKDDAEKMYTDITGKKYAGTYESEEETIGDVSTKTSENTEPGENKEE